MYVDKDYKVTTLYRKLDNVMLEDNCAEGIWTEQLEKRGPAPATAPTPAPSPTAK